MDVKQRLSTLLAAPHQVNGQDIAALKALSEQYPYFEPLSLLLAKAAPEDQEALALAALQVKGTVLYDFLLQQAPPAAEPETITPVAEEEDEVYEEIMEVDIHAILHPDTDGGHQGSAQVETMESQVTLEEPPVPGRALELMEQKFNTEEPLSVSNYDDDTLPYTFLWWLAKTRKAHQSTFQPYAPPKKTQPGELQQQYVEHIFHIQSPFNAEEVIDNNPKSKHIDPKETAIIDNFLKKDPQISPPKPEQIDTENKAKKSAEDHNDLVSETLAKIYIEQMLYHKAIDTYQKLSLKFPEKSRYFADLIQSLEKKI